ncbi:eukaryotic translation initiation factor 5 [Arachis hypogaea]|uniref:eukaryotic translation initiation factor 5 n=1 Tax=Arachis hypogaea TaxID=3818 RepID=UPI000DEC9CCD|nr:eukaryotic translation initiation factor 5 isoform X2 [Arachis hypogaea]QHO50221.1 Eukaryotic translation initiation factor [Arachis hypogaea]
MRGSENGDTVNYATVVREVKAYLKKGVAAKELQSHIAAFPVSAQEKMNALLEGLFDGVEKVFGKEATKRKNHLAGAVAGDDEGSQLLLLNAAEEFCYKKGSNELNEVALIPKALYDVDLVEEEHVMHWYSKGLKGDKKDSQVWKNAQPFIDWLRNAESESEEE